MITSIRLDLTDDERRAISGKSRPATRKEINEFVHRLAAAALDPAMAGAETIVVEDVGPSRQTFSIERSKLNCTTLDHCYPLGPKEPTTRCLCGQRTWGGGR